MTDFHDRRDDVPTHYHPDTPPQVRQVIDSHLAARRRGDGVRLRFHYGDGKTGQAWGDSETGYVGRSTGSQPIPLVVNNARSMGGGGILTHAVVKIEAAKKNRNGQHDVLYQHPKFKPAL